MLRRDGKLTLTEASCKRQPLIAAALNCAQWVEELKEIETEAASELGVAMQASTTPIEMASDGFFSEIFAKKQLVQDGRQARLGGAKKGQHPMYHVAWRGPRGGKMDHMELNNGTKIKFCQHSGA